MDRPEEMMKIKSLASFIMIMILMSTGCTPKGVEIPIESNADSEEAEVSRLDKEILGKDSIPNDQYENMYDYIGQVYEISENKLTIQFSSEGMEEFDVDEKCLNNIYIGQTVGIRESEAGDGTWIAEPFILEEPSIRCTSFNNMVRIEKGVLKKLELDNSVTRLTVEISGKEYTSTYFGETKAEKDGDYDFEVIYGSEDLVISQLYDNRYAKTVKINGFIREKDGTLVIYGKGEQGDKYLIPVLCSAVNFNYTDLTVGDTIKVYYKSITDSLPKEVEAVRIDKVEGDI